MRRAVGLIIATSIAALLPAAGATAQTTQAWKWCVGGPGTPPDMQTSACNLVIYSGKATTVELAIAYGKRCTFAQSRDRNAIHNFINTIEYCNEAIARDPKQAWHWFYRGYGYWGRGDLERALADFDEASRLDSQNRHAYYWRCFLRTVTGRTQQALIDCSDALRFKPDEVGALNMRGIAYLKLAELDLAIADFDAALRLAPNCVHSLYGRGLAKLKNGRYADGNADIAAAKAIRDNIATEYARYGISE
jgi:tetratricopeptide (TPR) repeat protein